MIRVSDIKLGLDDPIELIKTKLAKKLQIYETEIFEYHIYKESIDARKGIQLVYTVDASLRYEDKVKKYSFVSEISNEEYIMPKCGTTPLKNRPLVVGLGPSGLFAALLLAKKGYQPIVIERGGDVDSRHKAVTHFWQTGELDTTNNVQFGEGGAGTFSDGKLTTRVKDLRGRTILSELVAAGAPSSIMYEASPHIGTDLLRKVVKKIREQIVKLGGTVYFDTCLTGLKFKDQKIVAIQTDAKTWQDTDVCLMAIGHSARDTFQLLYDKGIEMSAKAFAVGVRIEHPQALIDKIQYKQYANHHKLRAAEYKLTHTSSTKRGVYSFCMCPGGVVVASSSEPNHLVTNGMSFYARDGKNANSAIVVQVDERDFASDHPLAGIEFQRQLESKAFILGGSDYRAPAMLVRDFLNGMTSSSVGTVRPTYSCGVTMTNFDTLFSEEILVSLREGLEAFNKRMPGFTMDDAIMTGVETRTSSPVRISRSAELESNIEGLYICGEGSGFAGGIMSASIDGMKVAEAIIKKYQPLK